MKTFKLQMQKLSINILQTLQPSFQQSAMKSMLMDLDFFFPFSLVTLRSPYLWKSKKAHVHLGNTEDALQTVSNVMLITWFVNSLNFPT